MSATRALWVFMHDANVTGRVHLRRLGVRNFRNIAQASLEPASRLNVFFGDNGHGKTSLIEALYVLSTTRSFRAQKVHEVVKTGEPNAELLGRISCLEVESEVRAVIGLRGRSFTRDGKAPKRKLEYALAAPVIAFHPHDLALVSGAASLRRNLLDRISIYLDTLGADARLRYQEGLKERQRLLADRGTGARELDAYEVVIAEHGARFALSRQRAVAELLPNLQRSFESMSAEGLSLSVRYVPGGTTSPPDFARELASRRPQDLRRGTASFGPHRDELELVLDGRSARAYASQGQQRLLALSLKLAELSVVRSATNLHPMLLLDDVSSELDAHRTRAVFDFLKNTQSQVFVTTTRPELFAEVLVLADERAQFLVKNGQVTQQK